MARSEFYDDPEAPAPNTLVVGVSAVLSDSTGRILLQRRADNQLWALPGGGMDLGESVPEAARREVREETGYEVEVTGIVGLYTDPRHIIAYSDGEVRRQFNICLTARVVGGRMAMSDESVDLRWVAPGDVDAMPMHETQRLRLTHFLDRRTQPYIG